MPINHILSADVFATIHQGLQNTHRETPGLGNFSVAADPTAEATVSDNTLTSQI